MEKTKSVQSLKRQLTAAIAMVLVAAIALVSATYAWFVANNQVDATTSTISAQSNSPYLRIVKGADTAIDNSSKTTITYAEDADTALYPAQVVKNTTDASPLFQSAYGTTKGAATELAGSRYNVGDATTASTATGGNAQYALAETFKIGTADAKAGSFKDLKVSKVEVITGKDDADGLKDAISVLLVCGEGTDAKWAVYKASTNGTVLDQYADSTAITCTATDGVLSTTVGAGDSAAVIKAYVFYDGASENVTTTKYDQNKLGACNIKLTFDATPVSTTGANGVANSAPTT